MTTVKTAGKKASTNGWTDETTALAISMYKASLGEHGNDMDHANSSDNLIEIQEATGAKSIAAVRSKLTSEKVYKKTETPRKVGGGSSLRKVHFVRAFANHAVELGLLEDDERDTLDSLETSKMDALAIVAKMLDLKVSAD